MNYEPAPCPIYPNQIPEYLARELRRIAASLRDDAPSVWYVTEPVSQHSLTAATSSNWRIAAGNVIRISASVTLTLTGLAVSDPNRQLALINVGTAAVVLKSEGTESSASYRFALPANWNLSANATAVLWYDGISSRWRGISRT